MFLQALVESACRKRSGLVAGLDPIPARFPEAVREMGLEPAEAVREFCTRILEAVEPFVAAVKLQAAYFERLGPAGMGVYGDLIGAAAELGLPTIADVKRGDVGPVAGAYAEAHLSVYGATSVTVNPYMGSDAVLPFLQECRRLGRGGGVFVLVATSNPSAASFQEADIPPPYKTAARLVRDVGLYTPSGYPDAGAVVGVTRPRAGHVIRTLLPDQLFLAPGYGAQGGTSEGVRALLRDDGGGVLVNSSRAILYAYEEADPSTHYADAARISAMRTRDDLREAGVRWGSGAP